MAKSMAEKRQLVVRLILEGKLDNELDMVSEAIRQRRASLNQIKLAAFQEGDEVVFNSKVKPKYLKGYTGKVMRVEGDRVWVDMGFRVRRYGPEIGCPASIIEPING